MPLASKPKSQSVLDHIVELRSRIFIAFGSLLVGMIFAHLYHQELIDLILRPARAYELIFLSPLDPLFFVLKVDLLVGLIVAFPVLSWCAFSFLKPALSRATNTVIYSTYLTSTALLLAGVSYAYFATIPLSLKFLSGITITGIENQITAQSYLSFFLTQTLLIAAIFQIPLLLFTGIYLELFSPAGLGAKRPYVYVGGTIALAILTPTPDIFNLLILLLPAALVFELSVLAGRVFLWTKRS